MLDLFVDEVGPADASPPVVLSHGMGDDASIWTGVVEVGGLIADFLDGLAR